MSPKTNCKHQQPTKKNRKNKSQSCLDHSAQRPALVGSCQRQEMTSGARSQRTHAALEHFGRPVPLICLLSPSDKLSSHGMTLQRSYDLSDPGWLSSADCSGGDEECVRALLLTSQLEILTYLYSGGWRLGGTTVRQTEGEDTLVSIHGTWNQMENTSVEPQSDKARKTCLFPLAHWLHQHIFMCTVCPRWRLRP